MSELAHIRKTVFRLTQADFAALAGATQGTVSRWESGALDPTKAQLAGIRRAALARGLLWNDSWFFETPAPRIEIACEARP